LLRKYTLLHNLINNNLKEGLFGTDSIHKVKPKPANLTLEEKHILGFDLLENPDLVDAFVAVQELQNDLAKSIGPDPTEQELNEFAEEAKMYAELE